MGRPKFSRVIASGSGPPRWPVSRASIAGELVGRELEVEDVEVLRDPLWLRRLRDHRTAPLQVPAQHHLRRGLVMGLGDATDHRVLQGAGVVTVAVEGDAADRGPGLGEDALLAVEGLHLRLGEVGVDLDLVHGRHDLGVVEGCSEVVDHEVADANGADLAVGEQRLQGPVGLQGRLEVRRQRLVQDQGIDLLDTELAGAFSNPCSVFSYP
jgi:hypothetical protein